MLVRRVVLMVAVALLVPLVSAPGAGAGDPTFNYVVHGTITNTSAAPVEGVVVAASLPGFPPDPKIVLGSDTTAADGTYEIAFSAPIELPFFNVELDAPPPYVDKLAGAVEDPPSDVLFDATVQQPSDLAVLEGTVRGAAGDPLEGVDVYLTRDCYPHLGCTVRHAATSADGSWTIDSLYPGEYAGLSYVVEVWPGGAVPDGPWMPEIHRDLPLSAGLVEAETVTVEGSETITVDALLQPVCPEPKPFPDIDVFCGEIDYLTDSGVIAGFSDGEFKPERSVTRQAFVAFLWRMAGEPPAPVDAPNFSDVGANHPFRTAIRWAASEGIVNGFPDGTFKPTRVITRQAFAAFLYRLAGEPAGPFPVPDPPVPMSNPFYEELAWLTDIRYEGIAWQGDPTGSGFTPIAPVLRQTVAAALYRADGEGLFDL